MPPSRFPFEVVSPDEMVPGNIYYFTATKDYKRKTNEGMVRKLSGIFQELVTHKSPGEREKTYAVFTKVKVEDSGAKTLRYNSGRILNPFFNNPNIHKALRNNTRRVRNVKIPGHQNLDVKTFGKKEWLFNVSQWKFGKGMRNAMAKYSAISALAARGVNLEDYIKPYFAKSNANENFNYVDEE